MSRLIPMPDAKHVSSDQAFRRTTMATRTARAEWQGDLKSGPGKVALGSGAFEGQYSFSSRFEEGTGTTPASLIGPAHAGCFSMALAHGLRCPGHPPTLGRATLRDSVCE